jgi:hypothetical protein
MGQPDAGKNSRQGIKRAKEFKSQGKSNEARRNDIKSHCLAI